MTLSNLSLSTSGTEFFPYRKSLDQPQNEDRNKREWQWNIVWQQWTWGILCVFDCCPDNGTGHVLNLK